MCSTRNINFENKDWFSKAKLILLSSDQYNALTNLFLNIYTSKCKKYVLRCKVNDLNVENNVLQKVRKYPLIVASMLNVLHTKNKYNENLMLRLKK